jgi:dTDP-glucose 4,6-dehydratase
MTIIVTGGAGFIGSNFVNEWLAASDEAVVNLDKLTYAGNLDNLSKSDGAKHIFVRGDINDGVLVEKLLNDHRPRAIINFAAESHVDRSIKDPDAFINTNIVGTFRLLTVSLKYFDGLSGKDKEQFRFLHVSTDEVYGSLLPSDPAFTEENQFEPNSPYSASKASADHLVRAYFQTYGLPTLTTNCSNNYGPYQFPEKLIPLVILNAISEKSLPIYGDGKQVRDWLFVTDHCDAIKVVLEKGRVGETYNIGGESEMTNLDVVSKICEILDRIQPRKNGLSYSDLITYVKDRPGHDRRYAIDIRKIKKELNWAPTRDFDSGLESTISWYLNNMEWVDRVRSGEYLQWINKQYG